MERRYTTRMIRVHFAEREPIDYDANEVEFAANGTVILRHQDLELRTDPKDIRRQTLIANGPPRLLAAWSPLSGWVHIEEIDEAPADGAMTAIPQEALLP